MKKWFYLREKKRKVSKQILESKIILTNLFAALNWSHQLEELLDVIINRSWPRLCPPGQSFIGSEKIKTPKQMNPSSLYAFWFGNAGLAKSESSWCVSLCTRHSALCLPSSYNLLDWLRTAHVWVTHTSGKLRRGIVCIAIYASLRSHSLLDGSYSHAYTVQDTSTPISHNQPIKGISEMN